MKALTVCQPYAELIASGKKVVENRTWATNYRGLLAIHAGKSRAWLLDDDALTYPEMVYGAVVAIARLRGCVRLEDLPLDLRGHDYAEGPWCWILQDVRRLTVAISWRGAQGLWDLPDDVMEPSA